MLAGRPLSLGAAPPARSSPRPAPQFRGPSPGCSSTPAPPARTQSEAGCVFGGTGHFPVWRGLGSPRNCSAGLKGSWSLTQTYGPGVCVEACGHAPDSRCPPRGLSRRSRALQGTLGLGRPSSWEDARRRACDLGRCNRPGPMVPSKEISCPVLQGPLRRPSARLAPARWAGPPFAEPCILRLCEQGEGSAALRTGGDGREPRRLPASALVKSL